MGLNDIHTIFFNGYILFSVALGAWAAVMAARNQPISGNFWGAVAVITIQAGIILIVGIVMLLSGMRPPRLITYGLYMAWLIVIMPGLFTLLRGNDDRSAAIAFSLLAFFNAATSFSMLQRDILGPWALPA